MLKLLFTTSIFFSISIQAKGDVYCTGKILKVLTYADGQVQIYTDWRAEHLTLCNLNANWKNVSPSTCAAFFATATMAQKNDSWTTIRYSGSTPCNALPTYANAPNPFYIMVTKAGI